MQRPPDDLWSDGRPDSGGAPVAAHSEAGPPAAPPPAGESLRAYLGRHLASEKYWDTVVHGFFSMVAIVTAFIIGNSWSAREENLRQLRAQQAVLTVLAAELSVLSSHVDMLDRKPAVPCDAGFDGPVWNTPVWDAVSKSERFLLIDEAFYARLRRIYGEVAAARQTSRGLNPASCLAFLDGLADDLRTFQGSLNARIAALKQQYEQNRRLFSWAHWRILTLAVLGLLVLWTSPLLLHTIEFVLLRRGRAGRGGSSSRAGPAAPDEGRPA